MVRIFSEHGDVAATRNLADNAADLAANQDAAAENRMMYELEALRYEIRAAAQTISSAIGAAIEEWRGETRGQR